MSDAITQDEYFRALRIAVPLSTIPANPAFRTLRCLCTHHPQQVCVGNRKLNCMDIEFKADRPKSASPFLPLASTASSELCLENDVMRAYRVTVAPGQDIYGTLAAEEGLASGCPYLIVVMRDAKKLSGAVLTAGDTWWRDGTSGDGVRDEDNFTCEDGAVLMIVQPK